MEIENKDNTKDREKNQTDGKIRGYWMADNSP